MMLRFRCLLLVSVAISGAISVNGQDASSPATDYKTETEIPYRSGDDLTEYMAKRCRLNIYYPTKESAKPFPTVVWFHGGGLTAGQKSIPGALKQREIAVVAVNYRLHPKVRSPAYVEDAAAAVAWTFNNIEKYGGSKELIFVSGHSAGGYLTSMVGIDKRWLAAHGIDANRIAGLIPYSGHTITHFTVRAERGMDGKQPWLDDMAPLFHVRPDAPPILFITGDRELEMLGRYEENAYMWRMMKVAGHETSELYELDGFDHGGMGEPAHSLMLKFVGRICDSL
jgi:acetyl esterase/lipase